MMDCDTTGIEPDISLVKYKKLVGGGMFKIVNNTVPLALKKLGYAHDDIQRSSTSSTRTTPSKGPRAQGRAPSGVRLRVQAGEGLPHHPVHGPRQDDGAAQPFLSGAISKTVNMPHDTTVERSRRPTSKRGRWA
jgi:ribonucleoside-diphosphate reductase alpha chain